MNIDAFNPLDMGNLAHSIVTRMLENEPTPLGTISRFHGAGLYAIYYNGEFPAYRLLRERNQEGGFVEPIYVGKAVPPGSRRGVDVSTTNTKSVLCGRLAEHAASVRAAINLDIADFWARWIVVGDIWIPLGESALLRRHRPVWNAIIDGFGNHDPGRGRRNGRRSRWDTLHPGRSWAEDLPERVETSDHIIQDATEYLRSRLA